MPVYQEVPSSHDDRSRAKLPPVAAAPARAPRGRPVPMARAGAGQVRRRAAHADGQRPRTRATWWPTGYARLVGYDAQLQAGARHPRELRRPGRTIFTFHLRKGHEWSDGTPFTTEDFRFTGRTSPTTRISRRPGPPRDAGQTASRRRSRSSTRPTIRYTWSKPNADFLPALALPIRSVHLPAREYLKQFHRNMPTRTSSRQLVKEARSRNWAALHNRMDNQDRNDNPKLPTLDPWVLTTKPPADRFVFERNPYYYRVDPQGHQLPYIDKVDRRHRRFQADPAQGGRGRDRRCRRRSPLRRLHLPEGRREATASYWVLLWTTAAARNFALYPNLNVNDPVWRDADPRRALPPCAVAGHRPARDQPGRSISAWQGGRQHGPAGKARSTSRTTARPGRSSTSCRRQTGCSTRSA